MQHSKYHIGDLVIAKLKFHSAWPAVIDSVESKRNSYIYNVVFCGTKDTRKCRLSEPCDYKDNQQKLSLGKKTTNDALVLAMKESEEYYKNRNNPKNWFLVSKILRKL